MNAVRNNLILLQRIQNSHKSDNDPFKVNFIHVFYILVKIFFFFYKRLKN